MRKKAKASIAILLMSLSALCWWPIIQQWLSCGCFGLTAVAKNDYIAGIAVLFSVAALFFIPKAKGVSYE